MAFTALGFTKADTGASRSIGWCGLRPDFRGIMLEHPLYFFQISPSARHLPLKKLRQISVKVTPVFYWVFGLEPHASF